MRPIASGKLLDCKRETRLGFAYRKRNTTDEGLASVCIDQAQVGFAISAIATVTQSALDVQAFHLYFYNPHRQRYFPGRRAQIFLTRRSASESEITRFHMRTAWIYLGFCESLQNSQSDYSFYRRCNMMLILCDLTNPVLRFPRL